MSSAERPTSRARLAGSGSGAEGAPNVLFIVLDDTGFGQLGCYGSPIKTPQPRPRSPADGLRYNNMHTTALCSPVALVHPHRPQPSLERAWRCITEGATGYPGYNGIIPFENGFLSEMLLEHGYNTYLRRQVAPDAEQTRRPRRARTTAGRSGAASSASTASSAATRTSTTRSSCYDNHQVEPREDARGGLPPDRGSGRQGRSRSSPTAKQVAPDKPFFLLLLHRRDARAAPRAARSGPTSTRASSTTAGTPYREKTFARQKELGIVPAEHGAVTPRSRRPGLGRAAGPTKKVCTPG